VLNNQLDNIWGQLNNNQLENILLCCKTDWSVFNEFRRLSNRDTNSFLVKLGSPLLERILTGILDWFSVIFCWDLKTNCSCASCHSTHWSKMACMNFFFGRDFIVCKFRMCATPGVYPGATAHHRGFISYTYCQCVRCLPRVLISILCHAVHS